MLTLQDEKGNIFRAVTTYEPKLTSSSKWFSVIKYINDEPTFFHFIKGNGSHFYFLYKSTWHRMLKTSIAYEELQTKYIIILEDWYYMHNKPK